MKCRRSCSVTSKSKITPSLSGRMTRMSFGPMPYIFLASRPTASTRRDLRWIATTDGSFTTMPLPRTSTSVLAVPRSMPMSRESRPNRPSRGLNIGESSPCRVARSAGAAGLAHAEPEASLLQTNVSLVADDQVIEDIDVEHLAGLGDLASNLNVLVRGGGVAARVVVYDDKRRGVLANRLAEQLGHAHDRGVQTAAVDRGRRQDLVLRIEQHHAQMLLLKEHHLWHQQVR